MLQVHRQRGIGGSRVKREFAETVDDVLAVGSFEDRGWVRKGEDPAAPRNEIGRVIREVRKSLVGRPDHQWAGKSRADLVTVEVEISERTHAML